jgi:hypothetical protein
MAFIGNTVQNQGFTPAIDYFNGNGVTVTFTLSRPIASVAQVIVAVDNVIQNPSSAFNVVGNSITFTSAPLSGTNNIWVEYTSLITTYQGISQDPTVIGDIRATGGYLAEGDFGNSFIDGAILDYVTGAGRITVGELDNLIFYHGGTAGRSVMMDLYYAGGAKVYGTTALTIPVGTTGERPGTPAVGMHRMNTTTGFAEYYTGTQWASYGNLSATSVQYVVIAGGAGAGSSSSGGNGNGGSGGGGAGGYRSSVTGESSGGGGSAESPLSVTPGTTYTVTVGAGGSAASAGTNSTGASGSNSVFGAITSVGGGGGASAGNNGAVGASGGSGGGGGAYLNTEPGSGTSGQGYAGGQKGIGGYSAAGGGGAASVGGNGTSTATPGGNGGSGVSSSVTGSSVNRAGGGGGGSYVSAASTATGGGGAGGGSGNGYVGQNATSNTGGGGGGCGSGGSGTGGGNGGSGIVIISYPSTFKDASTTGTVIRTTSGGNTIYTFTGSGTITF